MSCVAVFEGVGGFVCSPLGHDPGGNGDAVQRLSGNLQVDIFKARQLLGWLPLVSVEEGLRRAVGMPLHETTV